MPKEGQERAANGEGARNAAASNQARAAGASPPGFVPGSQAGAGQGGPLPVNIVSGQSDFFEGLRRAMGMGSSTIAGAGPAGDNDQLRAMITSQEAMTQAVRQTVDEIKVATTMMRDLQVQNSQMTSRMTQALSQFNQQNSAQMNNLLTNLMNMPFMGGGHGGPGGEGHGGGSHGFIGYTGNQYVSYGNVQSRARAALANYVNNSFGSGAGRHANISPHTRQVGATVSQGIVHGGLMSGLRRLPVAGTGLVALEGMNQGAEWLGNQAAQNARYQAITGGGNIGDVSGALGFGSFDGQGGLANRISEEGYVLGQRFSMGGMSTDQARSAFQGMTALGFTGQRRNDALDFAGTNYRSMGMDPNQSVQLAAVSAKYAMTNLSQVSDALMKVSQAAQVTGQSADTLRQTFVGNYQGALSSGAGGGAVGLAQALTMATAAGGRNLQGFSYGGIMQNPATEYAAAAGVGMSPTQLQYQASTGNILPTAQAETKFATQSFQSALGSGGMAKLQQLITAKGGASKVASSPGAQSDIATQLLPFVDDQTVQYLRQLIPDIPQDASTAQILQFAVNHFAGNTPASQAQQQQNQAKVSKVSDAELNANKNMGGLLGGLATGPFADSPFGSLVDKGHGESNWLADQRRQQTNASQSFGSTMGHTLLGLFGGNDSSNSADAWGGALDAYGDYSKKYGNIQDPAIQKAIEMFGKDPSLRVRVQTKDGTDRAVSLSEAIQHYPDQISTGSASIMSNDPETNGKPLNQVQGFTSSMTEQNLLPGQVDTKTSGEEYGQSAKEQEKNFTPQQKADDKKDAGGNVTIDFAPGAAQLLLRVVGSSNPNARPPASTNGPS